MSRRRIAGHAAGCRTDLCRAWDSGWLIACRCSDWRCLEDAFRRTDQLAGGSFPLLVVNFDGLAPGQRFQFLGQVGSERHDCAPDQYRHHANPAL